MSDEWRRLRALAEQRGLLSQYDAARWVAGGAEHEVRPRHDGGRIDKATHRNAAGFWFDFADGRAYPATPRQYLRRLELANEVFDDDIHLEGVEAGPGKHDNRIWTSQPFASGVTPDEAYLLEWLCSHGFERVVGVRVGAYNSAASRKGRLWLFDVRPCNFVMSAEEVCYAIDILVQRADDPE